MALLLEVAVSHLVGRGRCLRRPALLILLAALLAFPALASGPDPIEGEGQSEGGEEGPETKVDKAADAGISMMLLGSVAFMMGLFYLVNQTDKDMVKYSWQVISSTISIFSAVLLFQGINGLIESYLLEGASEQVEIAVAMAHFLIWLSLLQVLLAYMSGAVGKKPDKEPTAEDEERMERQMKCYSVLLGHITGFAGINAFSLIQQQMPRTLGHTFLIAPMAWFTVYLIGKITDTMRDHISKADDGKVDKGERLWDEATEETEDDVIGLAVSFVATQVLRFWITGKLPNAEGEEEEGTLHADSESFKLFGVGLLMVTVEFLRTIYIKYQFERLTPQLRNIVMMCFAWCLFFSMDWFLSRHFFDEGMMKQVALALAVTGFSMGCIFLLDKIADLPATGEQIDHAIRSTVAALGILIGFSWERSFDSAVASISKDVPDQWQPVTKLLMAIALAGLVVPAWRHFILPTILMYEKQEEEEAEEEAAKERGVEGGEGLREPLLEGKERPKKDGKDKNGDLKKKVKEYEAQISVMEGRNAKLEASLSDIVGELSELQKLANLLKR